MMVLAWILLLPTTGPYPVPFVDLAECRKVEAKYPGSECVSKKIFTVKPDSAAILPKENRTQ
jgi:hypothetical protein